MKFGKLFNQLFQSIKRGGSLERVYLTNAEFEQCGNCKKTNPPGSSHQILCLQFFSADEKTERVYKYHTEKLYTSYSEFFICRKCLEQQMGRKAYEWNVLWDEYHIRWGHRPLNKDWLKVFCSNKPKRIYKERSVFKC